MSISVLNTDAGLSGKTIINLEDAQTVTGLKTYDRDPNPPFAVSANSAVVPNLIAESLSGGTVAATTGTFSSTLAVTGIITGRGITAITNTETGSQNNWAPTGLVVGNTHVTWSGASDITVTGVSGGTSGQTFTLFNSGSAVAYFAHQSGSSTAANRFYNTVTSAATPVAAGGHATWVHNGTYWILVEHQQGSAISISYNDANFLGVAVDADWQVAVGDFAGQSYMIIGRSAILSCQVLTTTVQNTPATLTIAGWPFTINTGSVVAVAYANDNTTVLQAFANGGGNTTISLTKANGAAWANSTNATYIYVSGVFPLT